MNRIDFNTSPAGFPLESDAILGFMQQAIIDGLLGVAEMGGPSGQTIVSGCTYLTPTTVSDGWVMIAGELLFFEGGTVQANVIIEETKTQKANENGTLVDRIIERKAKFGTGATSYGWINFSRVNWAIFTQSAINWIATGGKNTSWVILTGLESHAGGITSGVALYNGVYYNVPAYTAGPPSAGSPVYLHRDGQWSTNVSGFGVPLTFDPYPEEYMERYHRNAVHPLGSIIWMKTADASTLQGQWFLTGLGFGKWKDWAVANGSNGTLNLSSAITGLTAIQRIA